MSGIYVPKRVPYAHQKEALSRMKGRDAFALLMEMRTGKTKVILDEFGQDELDGNAEALIVSAPGGAYRTWEAAVEDHVSADLRSRLQVLIWDSGKAKSKGGKRALEAFLSPEDRRPRFLSINIEALTRVTAAQELVTRVMKMFKTTKAVDESTVIKNPGALGTKFMIKEISPLAQKKRILSGLVTPNSPGDLYSQFDFLDPRILGFRSYYGFKGRFAITRPIIVSGRVIQDIVGWRDLDEIQARIAPHSYRIQFSDCYDMPEKIYILRDVPLTKEQETAYLEMKHFATTKLASGDFVTATIVIAQIIRLHQILCGFVTDEGGKRHEIPELRTEAIMEALEEYPSGKAIIWCAYDPNIRRMSEVLEARYGKGSVARFWGGNKSTREAEETLFKADPKCRWMVATAAAGGRGRTWDVADLTLYHSCTPNLEHRSQSEERLQGIGKMKSATYIDFICKGRVEEKYIKCLREKIDVASIINGDNYREWLI